MLADHCRDCTTCDNNYNCKLQEMAKRFGIKSIRYDRYSPVKPLDVSSLAIVKDPNKCILCGDCVRMCAEVQHVGAMDFTHRGSKVSIEPAFGMSLSETNCVSCGQCAAVCPTGALTVKDDTANLWEDLYNDDVKVVAQIAPAVRVALGDEFDYPMGENVMGTTVAALKRLGFDEVYDTATGADLTIIEESAEMIRRFEKGENLPLFTSCCPAWFKYAENNYPELMGNVSSCKSPMEMFGSVLKEYGKNDPEVKKIKVVAIMPCTAKKAEAARPEFKTGEDQTIDYSITTVELAKMIKEAGIKFDEILPQAVDMPFGIASGAGVIFGTTGGVTEAVIRNIMGKQAKKYIQDIGFIGVRGLDSVKEVAVPYGDKEIKIAIVSGLGNADSLIRKIKAGEAYYDFVEVMACPGGCIEGAGQPFMQDKAKAKRSAGIYETDRTKSVKITMDNPIIEKLYQEDGMLYGENAHRILHYK